MSAIVRFVVTKIIVPVVEGVLFDAVSKWLDRKKRKNDPAPANGE